MESYISGRTIDYHYGRHHKKYYEEIVARVKGTEYEKSTLEKIIKDTYGKIDIDDNLEVLHFMALMAWNHNFY